MTHGDSDTQPEPGMGIMRGTAGPVTDDEAVEFMRRWQERYGGVNRHVWLAPSGGTRVTEAVEEWAEHYAGGAKLVRAEYPDRERIFPHELWLKAHTSGGGKVSRRRIIVVEDWTEVRP